MQEKSACALAIDAAKAKSQATITSLNEQLKELEDASVYTKLESEKEISQLQKKLEELEELVDDREQRLQDQNEALNIQKLHSEATERNLQVITQYMHCM